MKTKKIWLNLLLIGSVVTFYSCGDDSDDGEGTKPEITVESIMASGTDLQSGESTEVDLNGSTAAENVPLDPTISVTFSRSIDASTATNNNFRLTEGSENVPLDISANGAVVTLTPQAELERSADYTLTILNGVKAEDGGSFTAITREFTTAGAADVEVPQAEAQVAYFNFDGSAVAAVGEFEPVFEQVEYGADRHGFEGGAVVFGGAEAEGQGDIIEYAANEAFISPSMTHSVWFKVDEADYTGSRFMYGLAAERGYFMELGTDGIAWMKLATSHMLDPDPMSHGYGTSWTDVNGDGNTEGQFVFDYSGSVSDLVADGEWHQLVVTYDAESSLKTVYIDGQMVTQVDIDSETEEWYLKDLALNEEGATSLDANFTLGFAGSRDNEATSWAMYNAATNTFKGMMDDLRIFNVALSESEVSDLYNAEN